MRWKESEVSRDFRLLRFDHHLHHHSLVEELGRRSDVGVTDRCSQDLLSVHSAQWLLQLVPTCTSSTAAGEGTSLRAVSAASVEAPETLAFVSAHWLLAEAIRRAVEERFPGAVAFSDTPTPTATGALEVSLNGNLVHSRLKQGDGYVDTPAKMEKMRVSSRPVARMAGSNGRFAINARLACWLLPSYLFSKLTDSHRSQPRSREGGAGAAVGGRTRAAAPPRSERRLAHLTGCHMKGERSSPVASLTQAIAPALPEQAAASREPVTTSARLLLLHPWSIVLHPAA